MEDLAAQPGARGATGPRRQRRHGARGADRRSTRAATTQDCRFPSCGGAGLLLLLYGREVAEIVYSPATRAGDDLAQVKQALQQQRDKTEKLVGELTTTLAQVNRRRSRTATKPRSWSVS